MRSRAEIVRLTFRSCRTSEATMSSGFPSRSASVPPLVSAGLEKIETPPASGAVSGRRRGAARRSTPTAASGQGARLLGARLDPLPPRQARRSRASASSSSCCSPRSSAAPIAAHFLGHGPNQIFADGVNASLTPGRPVVARQPRAPYPGASRSLRAHALHPRRGRQPRPAISSCACSTARRPRSRSPCSRRPAPSASA